MLVLQEVYDFVIFVLELPLFFGFNEQRRKSNKD